MVRSIFLVAIAACFSLASGQIRSIRTRLPPSHSSTLDVTQKTAYFDQYIDHDHPALGTFRQRYFYNDEFFAGPGSPVFLFTPGETHLNWALDKIFLTNLTNTGLYAQKLQGAVIILEHRYWGESTPYANLSTKNLQYLTLKNAIADLNHFAKTVQLPFDSNGCTNAPKAPWVQVGGSYGGALAAWTATTAPGTFWAYSASSAPVEAIHDFWQYYNPIQKHMPQNCSSDVSLVTSYIDKIFAGNDHGAKAALKTKFGLSGLQDGDFAAVLSNVVTSSWQPVSPATGYTSAYKWCDFVENAIDISGGSGKPSTIIPPSAKGVGLQHALEGYAAYVRTQYVPGYCASLGVSDWTSPTELGCLDNYNASSPLYTDHTANNHGGRTWSYFLCNEPFGWWESASPQGTSSPTIMPKALNAAYFQRQCSLYFPTEKDSTGVYTYGSAVGRTEASVNNVTRGWHLSAGQGQGQAQQTPQRLMFVNGEFDPWRSASVSSQYRPGGPLVSTSSLPVFVMPNGGHCSDMTLDNSAADPEFKAVFDQVVA